MKMQIRRVVVQACRASPCSDSSMQSSERPALRGSQRSNRLYHLVLLGCCLILSATLIDAAAITDKPLHALVHQHFNHTTSTSSHTNNWAVIVSTSRYWFNYRHVANALSIYHSVRHLGIPDSNIILMLPDNYACNPRNLHKASIYNSPYHHSRIDLYGGEIEVDYRGEEVTVENFLRLLTNKHTPDVPRSKRLLSDSRSQLLIYMTGHGGNEFLKFQDIAELSATDIGEAIHTMDISQRYSELLFIVDTCQASTLHNKIESPNTIGIGSSQKAENSYSYHHDEQMGVAVIDRFTASTLDFVERYKSDRHIQDITVQQLFDSYETHQLLSQPAYRADHMERPLKHVKLTDFFGAVSEVYVNNQVCSISKAASTTQPASQVNQRIDQQIASLSSQPSALGVASQHGLLDTLSHQAQRHASGSLAAAPLMLVAALSLVAYSMDRTTQQRATQLPGKKLD